MGNFVNKKVANEREKIGEGEKIGEKIDVWCC